MYHVLLFRHAGEEAPQQKGSLLVSALPPSLQCLCLDLSMLSWDRATLGLTFFYSRFLSKMTVPCRGQTARTDLMSGLAQPPLLPGGFKCCFVRASSFPLLVLFVFTFIVCM